jgi:hypothetical protein
MSRGLHRTASLFLLLPLVFVASTAVAYRVGRSWFGMGPETGAWVMSLHEGRFLGESGRIVYVVLVGAALLVMCITGLGIVLGQRGRRPAVQGRRRVHRMLALVMVLPLLLIALTGVAYRVVPLLPRVTEAQVGLLLRLHEGTYFGSLGRTLWTGLAGGALVVMAWTGLRMALQLRRPVVAGRGR